MDNAKHREIFSPQKKTLLRGSFELLRMNTKGTDSRKSFEMKVEFLLVPRIYFLFYFVVLEFIVSLQLIFKSSVQIQNFII